jgi:cation transport protein ChaC
MMLTEDLVRIAHRVVDDAGPDPDQQYQSEADYARMISSLLASHRRNKDLWIFAYGSLLWKPEIAHAASRIGRLFGWHRAFCLRITRFRGSKEQPGLMMSLDRGGQCQGVLLKLPSADREAQLLRLLRREVVLKPSNNCARWVTVTTASGVVPAIAFVANRSSPGYVGKLGLDEVAENLCIACGHWGSGAEYLYRTVSHLASLDIKDRNLWRLQGLVAQKIAETAAHSYADAVRHLRFGPAIVSRRCVS